MMRIRMKICTKPMNNSNACQTKSSEPNSAFWKQGTQTTDNEEGTYMRIDPSMPRHQHTEVGDGDVVRCAAVWWRVCGDASGRPCLLVKRACAYQSSPLTSMIS
jgi:hypothetical protein